MWKHFSGYVLVSRSYAVLCLVKFLFVFAKAFPCSSHRREAEDSWEMVLLMLEVLTKFKAQIYYKSRAAQMNEWLNEWMKEKQRTGELHVCTSCSNIVKQHIYLEFKISCWDLWISCWNMWISCCDLLTLCCDLWTSFSILLCDTSEIVHWGQTQGTSQTHQFVRCEHDFQREHHWRALHWSSMWFSSIRFRPWILKVSHQSGAIRRHPTGKNFKFSILWDGNKSALEIICDNLTAITLLHRKKIQTWFKVRQRTGY